MVNGKQAISILEQTAKYVQACSKRSILGCKPQSFKSLNISELHFAPKLKGDVLQITHKAENPIQNIIKMLSNNKAIKEIDAEGLKTFCKSIDAKTNSEIERLLAEGKEPIDIIGHFANDKLGPHQLLEFGRLCKLDKEIMLDKLTEIYSKGECKTLDEIIKRTDGFSNNTTMSIIAPEKLNFLRFENVNAYNWETNWAGSHIKVSKNDCMFKIGHREYPSTKELMEVMKKNVPIPEQEFTEYCKQLIECDYMAIQALGVKLLGAEKVKGKTHNEIFTLLKQLDMKKISDVLRVGKTPIDEYVIHYFSRDNIYQPLTKQYKVFNKKGESLMIGGDCIVHEFNNSLKRKMKGTDLENWIQFCKEDELAKKYIRYFSSIENAQLLRKSNEFGISIDKLKEFFKPIKQEKNKIHNLLRRIQRNTTSHSEASLSYSKKLNDLVTPNTRGDVTIIQIGDGSSGMCSSEGEVLTVLHSAINWKSDGIYIPNF